MKVFISWSGDRSRAVAEALRTFLPEVIQSIEPFMSEHDIGAGSRWGERLAVELNDTNFGILCLTPENLDARWLLFEAGALSKQLDEARLCPYRIEVENEQLTNPLSQFHSTPANQEGTLKLLRDMNKAAGERTLLDPVLLDKAFQKWWPDFETTLKNLPAPTQPLAPPRPDREILTEVLEIVRQLGAKPSEELRQRLKTLVVHFVGGSRHGTMMTGTPYYMVSHPLTAGWIYKMTVQGHPMLPIRMLTVEGEQLRNQRPLSLNEVRQFSELYQVQARNIRPDYIEMHLHHVQDILIPEYSAKLFNELAISMGLKPDSATNVSPEA